MMFRQLKVGERLQPFTGTTGQGQAAMLVIAVVDMPDHYGTALEPDELGTRIVRIWGLESIDCDRNLPQRRLPSSDIECTVYRNDRRVHVTIHADDSNRPGLYDTDGKALKPVGKD